MMPAETFMVIRGQLIALRTQAVALVEQLDNAIALSDGALRDVAEARSSIEERLREQREKQQARTSYSAFGQKQQGAGEASSDAPAATSTSTPTGDTEP